MIIVSYQGPSFSDIQAVRLPEGLDADEYIARLPEASCAFRLNSADDVKMSWPIVSKIYNALAPREDKNKKFETHLAHQDALYKLVEKVATDIEAMPASRAGKVPKDDEKAPPVSVAASPGTDTPEPRIKRDKPPKIEDKWSKMTVDQMAAAAKKLGYKEEPAPNGGVRSMRLRNWLRKNGK